MARFTTKDTPSGTVELFKDGKRILTGTREAVQTEIRTQQAGGVETPSGAIVDPGTGKLLRGPSGETPISKSAIRRHIPTEGTLKTEREKVIAGLDITPPTEAEKQAIRDRELEAVQEQLDIIERSTAVQLREEVGRAETRAGRTRALSARGGRLVSEFGERERRATEVVSKEARESIIVAQAAKKEAVVNKARIRAAEIAESRKTEALESAEVFLEFMGQKQTEAREDMKSLAATGVALETLDDEEYGALFEQSGYDPVIFEAVYNESLPKAEQIDYKYFSVGGGKIVRFDPAGGEPEEFDFPVDIGEGETVEKIFTNGQVAIKTTKTDEAGKIVESIEIRTPIGAETVDTGDGERFSPEDIRTINQAGLGGAAVQVRTIFVNTPSKFRQSFVQKRLGNANLTAEALLDELEKFELEEEGGVNPFLTGGGETE